jgi:arsenate reductase
MEPITFYEKPTCSTCQAAKRELRASGIPFRDVNYYEESFTETGLRDILRKLNLKPRDILRTREPIYRELNLAGRDVPDRELIRLMVEHPDLIQRPIVVRGSRAILARPVDRLSAILKQHQRKVG